MTIGHFGKVFTSRQFMFDSGKMILTCTSRCEYSTLTEINLYFYFQQTLPTKSFIAPNLNFVEKQIIVEFNEAKQQSNKVQKNNA